jgi:hypothetical protein
MSGTVCIMSGIALGILLSAIMVLPMALRDRRRATAILQELRRELDEARVASVRLADDVIRRYAPVLRRGGLKAVR